MEMMASNRNIKTLNPISKSDKSIKISLMPEAIKAAIANQRYFTFRSNRLSRNKSIAARIQETVTINSGGLYQASANHSGNSNGHPRPSAQDGEQSYTIPTQRLAPTQRLSEVRENPLLLTIPLTASRFMDCLIETTNPSLQATRQIDL